MIKIEIKRELSEFAIEHHEKMFNIYFTKFKKKLIDLKCGPLGSNVGPHTFQSWGPTWPLEFQMLATTLAL